MYQNFKLTLHCHPLVSTNVECGAIICKVVLTSEGYCEPSTVLFALEGHTIIGSHAKFS
jgi:hypothetical protein